MAASKKLTKFLKKMLQVSPRGQSKPSISRHSSATSNSFDSSSLGVSSGRSWGSTADIHSYDSDMDCSCAPADVPSGCLAVYVGKERQRFVIPTAYLTNNVFRALLAKSEEEFGFCCDGGLRIACSPDVFEHLLWWLEGATSEFANDTEISESFSAKMFANPSPALLSQPVGGDDVQPVAAISPSIPHLRKFFSLVVPFDVFESAFASSFSLIRGSTCLVSHKGLLLSMLYHKNSVEWLPSWFQQQLNFVSEHKQANGAY